MLLQKFWALSTGMKGVTTQSTKMSTVTLVKIPKRTSSHNDTIFKAFYFYNWYNGGVESNWVHWALQPPIGLLCQPRVIMMLEELVEWLEEETEVLRENLSQCRFVHHEPHMLPGCEFVPWRWEARDQPLMLRHGYIHCNWAGLCSRPQFHSRGARFKSRAADQLSWFRFRWFPSVPPVIQSVPKGMCQTSGGCSLC
jgi:hypothetical protein